MSYKDKKIKVLALLDSPTVSTGFATVSKNIVKDKSGGNPIKKLSFRKTKTGLNSLMVHYFNLDQITILLKSELKKEI